MNFLKYGNISILQGQFIMFKSINPFVLQARQRKINTQAAYHEFIQRQYDKSMGRFQKSNVEVANVIGLFPDLLSKKMQERQDYPPDIVEARKYLATKDVESGELDFTFLCFHLFSSVCTSFCLTDEY